MSDISNNSIWSETDASNTQPPPSGWPTGMSPSDVKNVGRMAMGSLKRFWNRINATQTSTGSANAYSLTYAVGPASYVAGETFKFIANFANTGPATIAINGLSPVAITRQDGTALNAGDIIGGALVEGSIVGSTFQLSNLTKVLNPSVAAITSGTIDGTTIGATAPSSGSFTNVATNGDNVSAYPNGRNFLFNPALANWNGGTTFTTPQSGTITADFWGVLYDGSIGAFTVSQQAHPLGQGVVPEEPRFYLRWNQTGAGSSSTFRQLYTTVLGTAAQNASAGVRTLAGRPVVLSFWAKAESAHTMTATLRQYFGTGTSFSPSVDLTSSAFNLTTSWQQFSFATTLGSLSGKTIGTNNDDELRLLLNLPLNTTMTIDIANVQLERGTVMTPFDKYGQMANGSLYL